MNARLHRRGLARLVAATLLLSAVLGLVAVPASAHDDPEIPHVIPDDPTTPHITGEARPRQIVVVEVNGLIDPIMASYIKRQLVTADGLHAIGVVLQIDSAGSTIDDDALVDLLDSVAPVIGEFLFAMSDEGLLPPIGQNVTGDDGVVRRAPADDVVVSFVKLPLLDGLFHTAASPAVAYLLLLAGLSLLLLDFYTGGIGIAAMVAAVCVLLAAFGLGTLDVRTWALVLLIAGFVAFAVDIQTGVPRFWTAAGGAAVLAGSLTLFGQHSMSWIPLLVGLVGVGAFVLSGLPALVRTRYGTATVGREWLIGVEGAAVTDIDPDGTVEVHGARWRARVNRLTPLQAGEPLRVSGLSGVVLEVEPLEGAAVDYRQMRKKRTDSTVSETE
ncbi:NfeD family protein [Candidatus Poriferisodalis multihospitum]|uniref:NfeD family protein n=1 Tax=Candidatus Poriferisodalis multihospitum TaxID=2983191 RepID=UPI002B25E07D|nr:NfeD family protein [Candidatus Poriferisodalis multihospitum]